MHKYTRKTDLMCSGTKKRQKSREKRTLSTYLNRML